MQFTVKAMRKPDGIVETVLEAPNRDVAMQLARAQGMRVLSIAARRSWNFAGARRASAFPLPLFTQQLVTLLRAGLSLIDSIESLSEKEERPEHRKVLEDVTRALHEGKAFSQALGHAPAAFPDLYVALVRSSERTGDLSEILARYISYQAQVDQVKKKIVSASIYPALLLCVGTAVMLFLVGYVVPKFSQAFEEVGSSIPWLSQLLLHCGKALAEHQQAVAVAIGAIILCCYLAFRERAVREWSGRTLERMPGVRERLFVYQLGRFYRSLGMLLRGGIPILTALDMAKGTLKGEMRRHLEQVTVRVGEGLSLSRALEANSLMTPVALKLLRAGEQSGRSGEMLEMAADFYDEELARWVDWFVKLFEPILMTVIGALIGVIVVLMYMPIFELASSIQ
jgi:general secretion pathway protein F